MNNISKLTAQAQVSVPAAVRRALGIGPGSMIVWEAHGDHVLVRRAGRHSSVSIHDALFKKTSGSALSKKTDQQLKAGLAAYILTRHARP